MEKLTFAYLDKAKKAELLPELFDLLYSNMCDLTPSGLSRESEFAEWLENVSPALDKPPRQIITARCGGRLAGYLQYYTRNTLIVIEELQIVQRYRCTTLLPALCRYLSANLPEGIEFIEAYADRRNIASQKIIKKLGLSQTEKSSEAYLHFRGTLSSARRLFGIK